MPIGGVCIDLKIGGTTYRDSSCQNNNGNAGGTVQAGTPNHGNDHASGGNSAGGSQPYNANGGYSGPEFRVNRPPHTPGDGRILCGDHVPTAEERAQQQAEAARIQAVNAEIARQREQEFEEVCNQILYGPSRDAEIARQREQEFEEVCNQILYGPPQAAPTPPVAKPSPPLPPAPALPRRTIPDQKPPKDAIEPFYGIEKILLAGFATLEGLVKLYKLGDLVLDNIVEKKIGGGLGNDYPDNPSVTGHIFDTREGHIPDTPDNRALIKNTCNKVNCYLGRDKYGTQWFAGFVDDVKQAWGRVRDGKIIDGGLNNNETRRYNPQTGLNSKTKPTQKPTKPTNNLAPHKAVEPIINSRPKPTSSIFSSIFSIFSKNSDPPKSTSSTTTLIHTIGNKT